MTKEEKIKEAWGAFYVKEITEDGWLRIKPATYANEDFFDRLKFNKLTHSIRPKSLQGIEDNNEWIKIESGDDLPKDDSVYYWYQKSDHSKQAKPCNLKTLLNIFNYLKKTTTPLTHYKPIEVTKPPIY